MTHPLDLMAEIQAHLRRSGQSPTEFGRLAVNDPNFVFDLKIKGREPRRGTAERVRTFIARSKAEMLKARASKKDAAA